MIKIFNCIYMIVNEIIQKITQYRIHLKCQNVYDKQYFVFKRHKKMNTNVITLVKNYNYSLLKLFTMIIVSEFCGQKFSTDCYM